MYRYNLNIGRASHKLFIWELSIKLDEKTEKERERERGQHFDCPLCALSVSIMFKDVYNDGRLKRFFHCRGNAR